VANVLYRMGRLHLHRGMLKEALRLFQLGQIAAQDSGLTPNRTERRFGTVVPTTSPSPARPAGRRWWVRRSGRGRVQRDAERVACWGRGVRGPRA
jgi:hypothetical protein